MKLFAWSRHMRLISKTVYALMIAVATMSLGFNGLAQTVITEDFNDNSRGWWTGDDFQLGNFGKIQNGSYFISGGSPVFLTWAGFPEMEGKSDYTIEMTARMIQGDPEQSYGLMLGDNRNGNDIEFCLNSFGVFVRQTIAGELTFVRSGWEPCPPKPGDDTQTPDCNIHPFVATGSIPNRLTLIRNGSQYRFVVNGKLIKEATIAEPQSALIGVMVWSGATVEFQKIEVRLGADPSKYSEEFLAGKTVIQPFSAQNIPLVHQQDMPTVGMVRLENDIDQAVTFHFYSPQAPTEIAYSVKVEPGEQVMLQDPYELPISIGDDWGIAAESVDFPSEAIRFVRYRISRIEGRTFYIPATRCMDR